MGLFVPILTALEKWALFWKFLENLYIANIVQCCFNPKMRKERFSYGGYITQGYNIVQCCFYPKVWKNSVGGGLHHPMSLWPEIQLTIDWIIGGGGTLPNVARTWNSIFNYSGGLHCPKFHCDPKCNLQLFGIPIPQECQSHIFTCFLLTWARHPLGVGVHCLATSGYIVKM